MRFHAFFIYYNYVYAYVKRFLKIFHIKKPQAICLRSFMSFYFLFPKRIITTLNILKYKYIKSLYSVNAQYKEMFGVSNPL